MFSVPDVHRPLSTVRSRVPAANSCKPLATSPRTSTVRSRVSTVHCPLSNARSRAQVSMEYLMLAGVVMTLVLAGSYFFFSNALSSSAETNDAQIQKLGNDVVNAARNVYYQGNPTKVTVRGTMPDNVVGIDVVHDWNSNVAQLVFYARKGGGIYQVVFSSDVRLSGSISSNAGLRKILVSAQNDGNGVPYVYLSSESCGDGVCADGETDVNCFEDCPRGSGCSADAGAKACVDVTRSYRYYCVGSSNVREFFCGSGEANACVSVDSVCLNGCVGGACV